LAAAWRTSLERSIWRTMTCWEFLPANGCQPVRPGRLRFDSELSMGREARQDEQRTGSSRLDSRAEKDSRRPSAPLPSPPARKVPSEEAWPWFSGQLDNLLWFKRDWEDHVKHFHPDLSPEMIVEGLYKYCMVPEMSKVIEQARNPMEAWLLLESHFDRQTALIDGLVSQLLNSERAVNDAQILTYYNKVLRAIREAKELERLQDFLTPNQIETLLKVLPKKEVNYWRLEQMDVTAEDMPVAFYVFARRRAQELCSNAAAAKITQDTTPAQSMAWEGPCVLGDLCGKSHRPEACSMFEEVAPNDRLVVIQRKQLCHFCFRHSDSQPCPSQSLPACSVRGCMRMHHRLLHEALQEEEARVIVIEVEEELEALEEDEEFYAANFEIIGQGDSDEEEEEEPDREIQSPVDPEHDRPRLCQQRVPLEVNGILTSLHTLYDWESAVTLVRKDSARRIGLQAVRSPRRAVKGHKGRVFITDSSYYLPLLDADSNIQVICAHGVDKINTVTRTRLPHIARDIFPVIRAFMPWMETGAGPVELGWITRSGYRSI
jgi:hypothetical protein